MTRFSKKLEGFESKPWLRLYAEFAGDPKVQTMPEAMQRRLIMLLCLRCGNSLNSLSDEEIAMALRISDLQLAKTKKLFASRGFIDQEWNIQNWDKRQFSSDSSTERVRRHRNVSETFRERFGNGPDTDTDTDRESSVYRDTVSTQRQAAATQPESAYTPLPVESQNGNENQPRNAQRKPVLATLPDWERLCTAARKAGMVYDPSPQRIAGRSFRLLTLPERIAAIDGIHKRIACGEYDPAQPGYTHTLENYLTRKIWQQGTRPQTRGQPKRRPGAALERMVREAEAGD